MKRTTKHSKSSSHATKAKTPALPEPRFVISTACYVPSDSETQGSSDSYDERHVFTEHDFNTMPFMIDATRRGTLHPEELRQSTTLLRAADSGFEQIQLLLQQLLNEGYADLNGSPTRDPSTHLRASLGLNRPRSLSHGKNQLLQTALDTALDSPIPTSTFACFWDFQWYTTRVVQQTQEDGSITTKTVPSKPVEQAKVRSFYRQLKQRDRSKARAFRRTNENQLRNAMVPYRELRDHVKNHPQTTALVSSTRQQYPHAPLYMSFIDADSKALRLPNCLGIYSAYTALYTGSQGTADIMSTGYQFSARDKPLLEFASLLDRRVRTATANHFPDGIYFPEPNFVVRIPVGHDTVPENFSDHEENYKSPQEAPLLIKKVKQRLTSSGSNPVILFKGDHPLLTTTPTRAGCNKRGTPFTFFAQPTKAGQFAQWVEQDIVNITRNLSQSHVAPRDWAINLLHAFPLQSQVAFADNLIISDGLTLKNIAISLLARLYKSYDPLSLIEQIPSSKDTLTYPQQLQFALAHYAELTDAPLPAVQRAAKKPDAALTKPRRRHLKNTAAEKALALATADAITTREGTLELLNKLLVIDDVQRLAKAASASGQAVQQTLMQYLCMPSHNMELKR